MSSHKFVPQLHKRATIAIRKKEGNVVPDFMFNIETWTYQTVRAKKPSTHSPIIHNNNNENNENDENSTTNSNDTFQQLAMLMGGTRVQDVKSVKLASSQFLPAIPPKTALDVYVNLLRTLMHPIIENQIAEKIFLNDGQFIRVAFEIDDDDHEKCVQEAVRTVGKVSLLHYLENQKANINDVSKDDFASAEQYYSWRIDLEQDIESKIVKVKNEPHFQSKLIVDVIDASNLAVRDSISQSSDPFVIVKVKTANERKSKEKVKTKTVSKNLSPVWNEQFIFNLKSENSRMKFEVWDQDLAAPPDFMGHRTLLLPSLSLFFPQLHTLPLVPREKMGKIMSKKGKENEKLGNLRVRTQYIVKRAPEKCTVPEVLKRGDDVIDMFRIVVRMFLTANYPEIVPEISWMFNNFCSIFGVGRVMQKLVILEVLVANFLPKKNNIESIKSISGECSKDIFGQRCIAKKTEIDMYYQTMETLRQTLASQIEKYTYAFPVDDHSTTTVNGLADGMTLSGAVALYERALDVVADSNLRFKRVNFKEQLAADLEKAMEFNWEIWKNSEMTNLAMQPLDSTKTTTSPTQKNNKNDKNNSNNNEAVVTMQMMDDDGVTLTLLAILTDRVVMQLEHDVHIYSRELPKDIKLAERALEFYYTKLSGYISDVFVTKASAVSLATFTIYGKLLELHSKFEKYFAKTKKLDLQQVFRKYFDQWVSQAAHKLRNWAKSAIEGETWEPISRENGTLHTSSVVDIFTSFSQSRHFLQLLGPELKSQYVPFAKVVGNVVEFYGGKLKDLELQEIALEMENAKFEKNFAQFLQQNSKGVKGGVRDRRSHPLSQNLKSISLTASRKLCAVLNSLEVTRELLDEFSNDMEKMSQEENGNISQALKPTFTTLKTICDEVDDVVLTKMNRCINIIMNQALSSPLSPDADDDVIETHLAFLFWYLDQELEVLSANLYEHVFLRILRQIYVTLIRDVEDIIFPAGSADSNIQEEQALFIEAVLKTNIHPFFNAEGQGLAESFLSKHSQPLLEALALFRLETSKLTSLYSSLPKNSLIYSGVSAHQVLSVLASRKNDKKAMDFVTKKLTRSRSRTFKLKFNLDNKVEYLASFSCMQQSPSFSFVQLFITNTVVCWSASISNYRDLVSLTSISNVQMEDELALSFVSRENNIMQSYYFRSFARKEKLEQAYTILVAQANKVGNVKCTEPVDPTTVVKRIPNRQRAHTNPLKTSDNNNNFNMNNNNTKPSLVRKTSTEKLNELLLTNHHHPAVLRQKKEKKYRLLFGLPDDEPISHSYMCSLRVTSVGKMTIAQHYVCFKSKFPPSKFVIPIADIQVMEKKRTAMFNDAISIQTAQKTYFFSSFQKRDEVFLILTDLWDSINHENHKSP